MADGGVGITVAKVDISRSALSAIELHALIEAGRREDGLSHEHLAHALHHVELSGPLLADVIAAIEASGVQLLDDLPSHDELHAEVPRVEISTRVASRTPAPPKKPAGRVVVERPLGDGLSSYLHEIGRSALLSAEEEIELATELHDGIDADAALHAEDLDPATQSALRMASRRGARARARLIESNLRLVVSIARKYQRPGIQMLDLIQEGNIGLMKAVEKFDPTKGFRFSTYASFWIRQALSRAIADQGRAIRVPVHLVELINRIKAVERELSASLQRSPSIEELARAVDLSVERVEELLAASQDILSVDAPLRDDEAYTLGDTIQDRHVVDPDANLDREALDDRLAVLLGSLETRDRQVMVLRFGLDGEGPRTLDEVGKALNVTKERVRQIEMRALHRLKDQGDAASLRAFID
jgi:RNA polymerase sigma factor (sigma-70 family)